MEPELAAAVLATAVISTVIALAVTVIYHVLIVGPLIERAANRAAALGAVEDLEARMTRIAELVQEERDALPFQRPRLIEIKRLAEAGPDTTTKEDEGRPTTTKGGTE